MSPNSVRWPSFSSCILATEYNPSAPVNIATRTKPASNLNRRLRFIVGDQTLVCCSSVHISTNPYTGSGQRASGPCRDVPEDLDGWPEASTLPECRGRRRGDRRRRAHRDAAEGGGAA